ncbi:kinase-like domain-containing protein [Mucor mucedo]|uniref:kinase-like domain-containing protein n=1 Tax=Mucor mucedo TaxID=29922 RepID=UPI0022211D4D|nr:kinase-like domain-containing protein [Mucor mucedo]KAI7889779.1 kinase-like domain-containing protein [Mucor mucedo]
MEFCSLGDLSHYIKSIRTNKATKGAAGGLPERVVRHFLKQLANALQFLRSQNLVHRDIKPQNLLLVQPVDNSDLPVLKVADFGFARFLPNTTLADTLCGSPLYMGPEILSYKKYDAKADLWSVGAVLYEMMTGRPPFRAQNHIELLKKIQENNDKIHFPDEQRPDIKIGADLKDLVCQLLKKNPAERMSFEDFFQHSAVLTHTTPNVKRRLSNRPSSSSSYEPPPFAQSRWSTKGEEHAPWTSPKVEDEDILQEYIVLDRRIIETNQFADALDASPRNPIPMESPSSAVNIPISPSTPPFARERRTSTGSSAGSALAKALSKASVRLFGTSIPSPPKDHGHLMGSPHGFMSSTTTQGTMKHIERLACMAHAVAEYADQKYKTNKTEEAVVLYLKSLSILESGLNIAQQYWQANDLEKDIQPLNEAVQWMREKFNECLKRAESIKEHGQTLDSCVEKLLYDRALEMSRAAAVHELVGENITECEQDYQTAIWMLEAILQVRPNDEISIEQDDRRIITKFIDSIRHRITVLRKKMEMTKRV